MSARNQSPGTIKTVRAGAVMAEVVMKVEHQELVAVITSGSTRRMKLKVGNRVLPSSKPPKS